MRRPSSADARRKRGRRAAGRLADLLQATMVPVALTPLAVLPITLTPVSVLNLAWLPVAGVVRAAAPDAPGVDGDSDFADLLRRSFRSRGERAVASILQQDAVQRSCSDPGRTPLTDAAARELEARELAQVRYPTDGRYLGDWQQGEKIAQSGRGRQFSDPPGEAAGGNCYACHQLSRAEPAYGTLGPSLAGYGRLHGQGEPALRQTWIRLWDAQALTACSAMPRFGHQGILTEQQLRDLMALLLDPASPVNR